MNVLLFTHKNDIDGMGNAVLANLAFEKVDYILCGTFNLTENVEKYYENNTIYDYDRIYVTDLCLEDPILTKIANDKKLKGKIKDFDHHRTFTDIKYTKHEFINVKVEDENGLCCGTSLFYKHLLEEKLLEKNNQAIKEFVELTRQHDTWDWKNIYNNEKARDLAIIFDILGPDGYIKQMTEKLQQQKNYFEFTEMEANLIENKKSQIAEKMNFYKDKVIYKEILGKKAGIVFITYEYRNELAQYFKDENFDMDFAMMIALDPGVVCYRNVTPNTNVRKIAEYFGGKGHDKAASNPITQELQNKLLKILTEK